MRIAIIGAMEEETSGLKRRMNVYRKEEAGGGTLYSGRLLGTDAVLLRSGIGKVNAALTTALLIERYRPDLLINTGSAGAIAKGLNIGDVVIGSELVYSDVDATGFGYQYGQVPRMPAAYPAEPGLLAAARELTERNDLPYRVRIGQITTADSFIHLPERAGAIADRFPEALVTDMEGAAIAQTAYAFAIPFLAVRSVSDIAGAEAPGLFESHLELASANAADAVENWLRLFLASNNLESRQKAPE